MKTNGNQSAQETSEANEVDLHRLVSRTERGWAGHFCCANKCLFRRNTLLECGGDKIVISTVGLMFEDKPNGKREFIEIGHERYFETMVFEAYYDGRYYDANVEKQIFPDSKWAIDNPDSDDEANDMHEAIVNEFIYKLEHGWNANAIDQLPETTDSSK